jgi:hypothetical protein
MSPVREPLHNHTCLICRGNYPCWNLGCALAAQIVCDDCGEDETEEEEINRDSRTVC